MFVFNIKIGAVNKYLVMVLLQQQNQLGFTRPEDVEWVLVTNPNKFHFRDVTYVRHNHQVYALCDNGIVRIDFNLATLTATASHPSQRRGDKSLLELIDFREPLTASVMPIASNPVGVNVGPQFRMTVRAYLVESSDTRNLFTVFRFIKDTNFDKTVAFTVYYFNPRNHEWIAVDDIGDNAFFIGHNNSWSICPANEVNFHNGRIYFTNDTLELEALQSGGYDVGVYDVRSGQFEFLNIGAYSSSCIRSTWVTPVSTRVITVSSFS